MARSHALRLAALVLANILIPIAVLVFASGFFPYKPVLPGLATFQDEQEKTARESEAVFDRVVFMVVDALRSDFVYGYKSGFEFTQSLIRSGAAIPFTAHATPPTVTMPRVKALTTGSVPSFLDLILNFAESDTTSSLANQDTWLAQIKAKGGKIVFYGDDTWLKLFPGDFFARSDGTSSFFVSDFTEVDNNVTRHVPDELKRDDWDAMIMHYLGLDHIGHKTGPNGPNMFPKQREMDGIVKQIYEAMEAHQHHAKTLLVLAGDHGMNAGGNHGGSGPGETEPALLFASPKFQKVQKSVTYECPTSPREGTEFYYYTKVEQGDIVPVVAGLMNMPISKNSLGVFIPELSGIWTEKQKLEHLHQNSLQILNIIKAKYDATKFDIDAEVWKNTIEDKDMDCGTTDGEDEELAQDWAHVLSLLGNKDGSSNSYYLERAYYRFLNRAQAILSDTASSYNTSRMSAGTSIASIAVLFTLVSLPSWWPPNGASIFFTLISLLYGVMMFASSYVEEEQRFWYWLTPVWISLLTVKSLTNGRDKNRLLEVATAGVILLITHRVTIRWNQTGQKYAGDPDITHTFFPQHHILMWILVLITYVVNGVMLHMTTFAGIVMPELAVFFEVSLTFLAVVFKLNFTQADAPELVQGLATLIREYSELFTLVQQAQAVFGLLACTTIIVVVLSLRAKNSTPTTRAENCDDTRITLSERLHHLLTLFLITQTRTANIPLFLILEVQRLCLGYLTSKADPKASYSRPSASEVATSTLLLSHAYYFCMSGSNSISSLDLSNAYNGVADYNIAAVGVLLFASNWAGPIWWCSAAVLLMIPRRLDSTERISKAVEDDKDWVMVEHSKLHSDAKASLKAEAKQDALEPLKDGSWLVYIAAMTLFVSCGLVAVMAACTELRTHLFIWTVFSPKYLYAMAWAVCWHSIVNIGFGSLLYSLRGLT